MTSGTTGSWPQCGQIFKGYETKSTTRSSLDPWVVIFTPELRDDSKFTHFPSHCSKYHRSTRRRSDFRNFGAEAFEKSVFCYAPLKKRTDVGKQKHPAMTPYPQGAWKCSKWPFWGHFARWFWEVFKTWFSYRALSPDRGQLRIVTLSILEIRCATVEKTDKRCVTVEKTQKSFETAEKTDKSCVTLEKTHPWKRTWSPKAVSSQSLIFESIRKLREVESIFLSVFLASPFAPYLIKNEIRQVAFAKRKHDFRMRFCKTRTNVT